MFEKIFKRFFEACHLHSFTNIDVCSHISHGLPPVPCIHSLKNCHLLLHFMIVENLYDDNKRSGLQ